MVGVRKNEYAASSMEPSSDVAESELRVYCSDNASLETFVVRIGACRGAASLANLVVSDMMEHTILNDETIVKGHFIEALLVFTHFTKGNSVSNVRQQIRKKSMEALDARRNAMGSNGKKTEREII